MPFLRNSTKSFHTTLPHLPQEIFQTALLSSYILKAGVFLCFDESYKHLVTLDLYFRVILSEKSVPSQRCAEKE